MWHIMILFKGYIVTLKKNLSLLAYFAIVLLLFSDFL